MMRAAASLLAIALAGCAGAPAVGDLMQAPDPAPARQERRYEGLAPERAAPAVVAALQDLGFHLASSEPALGLIVATRGYRRKADELAGEVGQYMLQGLKNAFTFQWHRQPEPERFGGPPGFSAAVSITPAREGSVVRLTLHRYVTRPTGENVLVWAEEVRAAEPYARFFARLSETLLDSNAISSRSPEPTPPAR